MSSNTVLPQAPPQIEENDKALLDWIDSSIRYGLGLLKREQSYNSVAASINYINGSNVGMRQSTLSRVNFNRLRKNLYEIVSSMTDVRPIWSYHTRNEEYKKQGEILDIIVRNWWRNSYSDGRLRDSLMYSAVGGSGYLKVEWNPSLPGGGNIDLIPLDPRDVIPIQPSLNTSVQQWQGVAIRKTISLTALRQRYPEKFYKYQASSKMWFESKIANSPTAGAVLGNLNITSPVLERLFSGKGSASNTGNDVDLVFVYINDFSLNTGLEPKIMGRPDTNWCYKVYPLGSAHPITGRVVTEDEARLYPRGRLVVCTPDCILEDIPNPYWHGLFPVVKFTLDPQPWTILGSSFVVDCMSMQDSLNETLRGVEDSIKQWLRRTIVADKNAISRSMLRTVDSRLAGQKLNLNPTAGDGLKFIDGPQLPAFIMEYVGFLVDGIDDNSGVKGLKELASLKQMPSADTVEKYLESQSPLLRLRGRSLEQSLAELAEMVKSMIFQFYDAPRRIQILGPDGITMEDFDYDPRNMIPSLEVVDPNYRPEYDSRLSRVDRGTRHQKNFVFSVAPSTFLNTTNTQNKMFMLQLARMPSGPLIDPWTLLNAFDVPNTGPEPKGSIFDRVQMAQQIGLYPPSQLQQMQMQMAAQQQQAGGGGAPKVDQTPNQGPGRPPSGNAPPHPVMRTDQATGGQRMTVSESQ